MSFRILNTWGETAASGRRVIHKWADFGSIEDQLQYLRHTVDIYRATSFARDLAMRILTEAGIPDFNKPAQAVAIAEWVKDNIRYINEFPETFQAPPRTVEIAAGDCDDHTTLIASLCENVGIPTEVVGMKVDGIWKHVFPVAMFTGPGGKVTPMPLDSTLKNYPIKAFMNPARLVQKQGKKVDLFVPQGFSS